MLGVTELLGILKSINTNTNMIFRTVIFTHVKKSEDV